MTPQAEMTRRVHTKSGRGGQSLSLTCWLVSCGLIPSTWGAEVTSTVLVLTFNSHIAAPKQALTRLPERSGPVYKLITTIGTVWQKWIASLLSTVVYGWEVDVPPDYRGRLLRIY